MKKGFTLIELLVVIAIIGILAGIVIVNVRTARERSIEAAVKENLRSTIFYAEIYHIDNGSYKDFCFEGGWDSEDPSGGGSQEVVKIIKEIMKLGDYEAYCYNEGDDGFPYELLKSEFEGKIGWEICVAKEDEMYWGSHSYYCATNLGVKPYHEYYSERERPKN